MTEQFLPAPDPSRHPEGCNGRLPVEDYGPAIEYVEDKDGAIWVTNDEYTCAVFFCPFCGKAADRRPLMRTEDSGISDDDGPRFEDELDAPP